MRIAIATVVHDPRDARIRARQIESLVSAGHEVVFAAPFSATNAPPDPRFACVDVPRARGRNRRGPVRVAAAWIREQVNRADVILVHDPELVPTLLRLPAGIRAVPIWDVHENNPAAISSRPYVPQLIRPLVRQILRAIERRAETKLRLLLAEFSYQERFALPHPVVLNVPWVDAELTANPAPLRRVVYVGSLTQARGVGAMCELARLLQPSGIAVHLIGPIDDAFSDAAITQAQADGVLTWHGRMANAQALDFVRSSAIGLSLLHDTPNHHGSMPTKVLEYLAQAVPVVTTALPLARDVVLAAVAGRVLNCPPDDAAVAQAAATAIQEMLSNPDERAAMGLRGHAHMLAHYNWHRAGDEFVATLEQWVKARTPS